MKSLYVVAGLLAWGSAIADEDGCSVVLERAAANIAYRFGSATSASTQANALCDERYEKMSATEQQGIDASYGLFAASYSSAGSSLKEYRSKYCTSGHSSFFSASQSSEYSSQIYDASIAAWRDCKAMQSANVIISPVRTPDDRSVTVSIAYRGPATAKLTGVRISPKDAFVCTADQGKKISGAVNQQLGGDSFSFDCTRKVQLGSGPGAFTADASSITVTTSVTTRPFLLYFPAVASPDLRVDNAVKLRASIAELTASIKTLREEHSGAISAIKNTELSQLQGRIEDIAGRVLYKGQSVELFWPVQGQCLFAHGSGRGNLVGTEGCGEPIVHHRFTIRGY